jgi:hypothetical protein
MFSVYQEIYMYFKCTNVAYKITKVQTSYLTLKRAKQDLSMFTPRNKSSTSRKFKIWL